MKVPGRGSSAVQSTGLAPEGPGSSTLCHLPVRGKPGDGPASEPSVRWRGFLPRRGPPETIATSS